MRWGLSLSRAWGAPWDRACAQASFVIYDVSIIFLFVSVLCVCCSFACTRASWGTDLSGLRASRLPRHKSLQHPPHPRSSVISWCSISRAEQNTCSMLPTLHSLCAVQQNKHSAGMEWGVYGLWRTSWCTSKVYAVYAHLQLHLRPHSSILSTSY